MANEPNTPQPSQPSLQLTRFENRNFVGQTIHLAGNAYLNCSFDGCTLVFTGTPWVSQGCKFVRCNWRVEYDILWGAPESRSSLRRLLDLIDGAPDAASPSA